MVIDNHVHISRKHEPAPKEYLSFMDRYHIDRTCMFADDPYYFLPNDAHKKELNKERLERLMAWCSGSGERLLPVWYIDPTEPDALEQVDMALNANVIGFKVICERHFPGDERAMPVYRAITEAGKSILFHSGILWDAGACSQYNRPVGWECMCEIPNVKFALAHISWPWTDECIAVFGKFDTMRYWDSGYANQQMYIDMTPGTPMCYRREVFKRLLDVDYELMKTHLLFGSDNFTDYYDDPGYERDYNLFRELGLTEQELEDIFFYNSLRFWGIK